MKTFWFDGGPLGKLVNDYVGILKYKAMKSFKESGYLLLAIPRSGVKPLDLLCESGKGVLSRYEAPLYELFISNKILPPAISDDIPLASNISTEENLNLSIESNLSLLDALVQLIKTKLKVNVSYTKQSEAVLRLNDPVSQTISQLQLDKFLQAADLDKTAAGTVDRLFEGELYVIIEIIKAKSFTIENKAGMQFAIDAAAAVPTIAEGGLKLSSGNQQLSSITHEGNEELTFGIIARRIEYDKPGFFSRKTGIFKLNMPDDDVLVRGNNEQPRAGLLNTPDKLLHI